MSEGKFRELGKFACNFCKGELVAGYSIPADGSEEIPSLLHSKPPCKTFVDTEILEFLADNRKAGEISIEEKIRQRDILVALDAGTKRGQN